MQHVIKRQNIHLSLDRKTDAFQSQQMMSQHYWQEIVPALGKLFDEISSEDEVLYFDTLEVDIGWLHVQDISRHIWSDELLSGIIDSFREKLRSATYGSKKTVWAQQKTLNICQQWLHYMLNGYLPWNALEINEGWRQRVLEALSTDYKSVDKLRSMLRSQANVVMRIVEQHSESFLIKLLEILTATKLFNLPDLLHELEILYKAFLSTNARTRSAQKIEPGKMFWRDILQSSATSKKSVETQMLMHGILDKYFSGIAKQRILKMDTLSKLSGLLPVIQSWEQKTIVVESEDPAKDLKEISRNQVDQVSTDEVQTVVEEEGIFVQNAGAVLLHPFLNIFFNRLGLIKTGNFKDQTAHQKALYMIHYLCTGIDSAEEHELVIPKALCGYPIQKPVKNAIRLDRKEKEKAEHLLEEIIRQWNVLKSTSPTGLREGFLQRRGKLFRKDDDLHIQVETKAIDLLLDQLPWNLNIFKLPWMKQMIRVEWR